MCQSATENKGKKILAEEMESAESPGQQKACLV